MRVLAKLGLVTRKEVGDQIFWELCAVYPAGNVNDRGFGFTLPYDEERTQALLDVLTRNGYRPINPAVRGQRPPLFKLDLLREYDTQDFEQAELLRPKPTVFYDSGQTMDGRVTLVADAGLDDNDEPYPGGIQPDEDIAQAQFSAIVSEHLRRRLERISLAHVAFLDVVIDDPEHTSLPGPLWQLTSDLILPPLSRRNYRTDSQGQPLAPGERGVGGVFVYEGSSAPDSLYKPAELYYDRAALKQIGAFDLAVAHEWSGSGYLIASPRFYRFCVEEGLKMKWQPVRVAP